MPSPEQRRAPRPSANVDDREGEQRYADHEREDIVAEPACAHEGVIAIQPRPEETRERNCGGARAQ